MSTLPSNFNLYLQEIRLTDYQRSECKAGHETLRDRLHRYEELKSIVIDTFLQGSYRRATAIRPVGDLRSDVDIIVVTNLDKHQYTPRQAMNLFIPFLDEYYKGKWEEKGRSFGINLNHVALDLVITAAPSEVQKASWRQLSNLNEEDIVGETYWEPPSTWSPTIITNEYLTERASAWKVEPLDIPDREANTWDKTHPLAQIAATWKKNRETNRHFINIVKALKWWKATQQSDIKYPKGYPFEHLLWESCPSDIQSIAEGTVLALEQITSRYKLYAQCEEVPFVPDHGVHEHNILARLTGKDFKKFHQRIEIAAQLARDAFDEKYEYESSKKWQILFGSKFPLSPKKSSQGAYTPREESSLISEGRFA